MSNILTGSSGTIGIPGPIGTQGTPGPNAYQIIDWKNELMNKYPRFIITTEYDNKTLAPIINITDTINNKVSTLMPKAITFQIEEVESLIQQIITDTRQEIINNIING